MSFKQQVVEELESGWFSSISEAKEHYGIKGAGTVQNRLVKYGRNHLCAKVVNMGRQNYYKHCRHCQRRHVDEAIMLYNYRSPHQCLGYRYPMEVLYKEKKVHSYIRKIFYLITAIIVIAGLLTICSAEESQAEKPNENSKCYVCHPDMKTEELTTDHLDMDVTCDECHGSSTEHMHDEMLMTEPDLKFGRAEVERMCSNPSCHKPGGDREVYGRQDHKNPEAVEAFFEKWTGRMRPNGRAITHDSVCTDCHGTHNINKPLETKPGDEQQADWIAAFNGNDLSGWKTPDADNWKVQSGRIVGTAGASDKGSTLWTETIHENYLLAITFRATWPVHAGIWLRGTESQSGPRIEIFDSAPAYTGSVLIPEKGLALTNIREDLVDRESWNTISAKIDGDKVQVWLNGEEIGSVRGIGPEKGKIGLYIEKHLSVSRASSPRSEAETPSTLSVREVLIQKLPEAEGK